MRYALLLLLAASSSSVLAAASGPAVLTDDVYQLQPGEWRWVPFDTQQKPALIGCHYSAMPGGEVHAELVNRSELELIQKHKSHDTLDETDTARSGAFSHLIREPGEYAIVIENDGKRPAVTRLTVTMGFPNVLPVARYLPRERRLTVILISFALFFAIVTWSARALWKATGRTA